MTKDQPPTPAPTTRFINVSSLGALDIPGVGIVAAGGEIEVSGALAAQFIAQPDNWKKADK